MANNFSTYNEFDTNHSLIIGVRNGEKYYKTLFDEEDYEKIKQRHWRISEKRKGTYVCSGSKNGGGIIYLQWFVLNYTPKPGYVVDHINRNPLDNRKENLRIVKISENAQNIGARCDNKSTQIRGVSKDKSGNYKCDVFIDNIRFYFKSNKDLNYSLYIRFLWEKYIIKVNIIKDNKDLMEIIESLDKDYKFQIEKDFWNIIYKGGYSR